MDIVAILALVEKGMTIIGALVEAGKSAAPAIDAIKNLVSGAKNGTVSDADLDACEAQLDQMIDDFNLDIPV